MTVFSRRSFLASALATSACARQPSSARPREERFVCPPCGCSMDDHEFDAPGVCPDCGMTLAPKEEADLGFEPAQLAPRAGRFTLSGKDAAEITVHYYRPDGFTASSPVLLVIPGAGRNSDEYRNAWLEAAWSAGVLVAALGYPQADYDFAAYHMGGIVRDLSFRNSRVEKPGERATVIRLHDEDITFDINPDRESWLFADFDRVFDHIAKAGGSTQKGYDIFGHSAGGQILHRMAMFHRKTKAERIISANSGFYTLPDFTRPLPTGIAGTPLTSDDVASALGRNLTVLLGEDDNSELAGGTFLRTPLTDRQGLGRLQRGRHFYAFAQAKARDIGVASAWKLETVPGVGHDFTGMSRAAAKLLY